VVSCCLSGHCRRSGRGVRGAIRHDSVVCDRQGGPGYEDVPHSGELPGQ